MNFSYNDNKFHWLGLDIASLDEKIKIYLQENFLYSGPYYLYNLNALKKNILHLSERLNADGLFYSVKSLSNLQILKEIKKFPNLNLDVVSGGEIIRADLAKFSGKQMVFAGVGKTRSEITLALEKNIKAFHVESPSELKEIALIAASLGRIANVSLRLNPNIAVDTHEYIKTGSEENKFGISENEYKHCIQLICQSASLKLVGMQSHLGSQVFETQVYVRSLHYILKKIKELPSSENINIEYISLGGGFGIDYNESASGTLEPKRYPFDILKAEISKIDKGTLKIYFEPGRYISGNAGILITNVLYLRERKNKKIAICDAGMSELIRPSLYNATHPICSLIQSDKAMCNYDIVGPICESTDFLAKNIQINDLTEKSALAVLHTGAYGSVLSSNYNTRLSIPEILISYDNKFQLIRRPQSYAQLLSLETDLNNN